MSFGDNLSQPIFKVGKNLSKNVYVETRYQANVPAHDKSTNDAELGARYRFKPNWSLETYFGNRASGGVDVYWGRSYDIKRHKWWLGPPKRRQRLPEQQQDQRPPQRETP